MTYSGYCPNCSEKREFEAVLEVTDSDRVIARGSCPTCFNPMKRLLKHAHEKD